MDVVIISQYIRNIEDISGNNSRYVYLANILGQRNDTEVEVITSNFMHGFKRHAQSIAQPESFNFTALDEPGYRKNICLQRFYSHAALAKNIKKYLAHRKKPDCIYCAIPSLDVAGAAADYCRQNRVRFIVDIQDLWPEAFQMVFDIPIIKDIVFWPMTRKANRIYAQADAIVAVSDTYCQRASAVNKKCKETHPVFLGTKLEVFDTNAQKNPPQLVKPRGELWLGYCGSLEYSYDLPLVMDALTILKQQGHPVPKFIVMGTGARMNEFKVYAAEKKIDAVFTGLLSYEKMCGQILQCDFLVNPIIASSPASIINKHGDYASAGKPVLNTQTSPEYRKLVDTYHMGFNCKSGDAQDLANHMLKLIESEQLRTTMGANARKCAEEKFDRKHTYLELVDIITYNV